MRLLTAAFLATTMTVGAASANPATLLPISTPVPLNQVQNVPDRVANARVTDARGAVIGAVQRVELRDGRPARLDVMLMGSENAVTLDAATVRYDADTNVVATDQ